MLKLRSLYLSLCAAACVFGAGPTFYTNQGSFNTAAGTTPSTLLFNGVVSGSNSVLYSTASGLTLSGFQFVGTNGSGGYYLGAEGPQFFVAPDYGRTGNSSLNAPAKTSVFYSITNGLLTITTPSGGVTAFGLQLWDVLTGDATGAGTDTVVMAAGGGSGSVVTPATTGTAFLGFTSSTPVTSVTLSGTASEEFPTIGAVYYVTATAPPPPATPVPPTLILFTTGLAVLGCYAAWSRRGVSFVNR